MQLSTRANPSSERISKTIHMINKLWDEAVLPSDRKRLAENVDSLLRAIGMNRQELRTILLRETDLGNGTKTLNLSPYATIIQSLFNQVPEKMKDYLLGEDAEFKLYLCGELTVPDGIDVSRVQNVVLAPDLRTMP